MPVYRRIIYQALADQQWHYADDLAKLIFPLVRPEMLLRHGLRYYHSNADPTQMDSRQIHECMVRGSHAIARDVLRQKDRSGIESGGYGHSRRFRWTPQKFLCSECGQEGEIPIGSQADSCLSCQHKRSSPRVLPDYECPECHQMYRPQLRRQMYCGIACKAAACSRRSKGMPRGKWRDEHILAATR